MTDLLKMAEELDTGDVTAMDLEDNEVSYKIAKALRKSAATISRLQAENEKMREALDICLGDMGLCPSCGAMMDQTEFTSNHKPDCLIDAALTQSGADALERGP